MKPQVVAAHAMARLRVLVELPRLLGGPLVVDCSQLNLRHVQ